MVISIDYKTYNRFDNFFTIGCFSLEETERAIVTINGLLKLNHISNLYVSTMNPNEALKLLDDLCSLYKKFGTYGCDMWHDECEQQYQKLNLIFTK